MPKEMIRVGVEPVIEHSIEVLKAGGIKDVLIIVGREKGRKSRKAVLFKTLS
jgi:dTDP-glucose pyrophosphorylase